MHHVRSYPFKSKLFVKTKFISSIFFSLIVLPFVWRDSWLTVVFYLHVRLSSFPVRAFCWENSGLELWFNCKQALIYNNEWISLLNLQTLDNAEPIKKLSGGSSFGVCRKHKRYLIEWVSTSASRNWRECRFRVEILKCRRT